MRTSELNQLIESPERLQKDQINDLQDLISEYPFFTSAQLLLTKAFFETENLNFEKQLRLTAAYAGDRKKLHDLLYLGSKTEIEDGGYVTTRTDDEDEIQSTDSHSSDVQNSDTVIIDENADPGLRPSASATGKPEAGSQKLDSNSLSAEQEEDNKSDISTEFILSEAEGLDVTEQKTETGIIDENVPISDPQSPISESESSQIELDEQAKADQEFLDQQILSAAIGNSIVDELETGVHKSEIGNQKSEIGINDENDRTQSSVPERSRRTDSDPIEAPAENFDEAQPHSFSDWLKHYSPHDEEEDEDGGSFGSKSTEPKEILKSISKQVNEIQEKAEFYSAEKMARLSVTESEDLVTETLAKVFEDQGKFEKAIKAYEKLRLKFPEKRVYFAGRIKAVKKKLKS